MQQMQVQSLIQGDLTCSRATKPVGHSYWARALEPGSHNFWALMSQLLKPSCPRARALQQAAAAAAKSLQSCPTLCDIDGSPPGSPIPGILQARILKWVAISFSNAWKWKVKSESEVAQSCLTLSDPMDCSPAGSSVHGIFQARVLEWGAIAFSSHNKRNHHNEKPSLAATRETLMQLQRLCPAENKYIKKFKKIVKFLEAESRSDLQGLGEGVWGSRVWSFNYAV